MGRKKGFRIPGVSFSAKRALGITAMKSRASRSIGIPLTKAGRQRKFGAQVGCMTMGTIFLGTIGVFLFLISAAYAQTCCRVCKSGKPCGDSCISRSSQCSKPTGCACASGGQSSTILPLLNNDQSNIAPQSVLTTRVTAIDGDTIDIDGIVVRLEGIDAPEIKQECIDIFDEKYLCGRRAQQVLSRLLADDINCVNSGTDKYGRTLAYCTSRGEEINRRMVQLGWAFAFVKYNPRYLEDQQAASDAHIGMWEGKVDAPWDWRAEKIAERAAPGSCIIKGNISKGKKIFFLPFHSLYANVKVEESKGERWFCSEAEALAAGFRRALR